MQPIKDVIYHYTGSQNEKRQLDKEKQWIEVLIISLGQLQKPEYRKLRKPPNNQVRKLIHAPNRTIENSPQ